MDEHGRAHPPPSSSAGTPRRTVLRGAAGLALAWMTPIQASRRTHDLSRPTAGDLLVKIGDTDRHASGTR